MAWTKQFSGDRKVMRLAGPIELCIDYDDVDRDEVDILADAVLGVLNKHWPEAAVDARLARLDAERREKPAS